MAADSASQSPWPGYRTYPKRLNLAQEVIGPPMTRGLGSHLALIGDGGSITYETLERQVNAVAAGLLRLGLKQGDLALIKMSNCAEFAAAFLAAVKLGIIPVLVHSMLSSSELKSILEQAKPRLVFTETVGCEVVRELRRDGLFKDVVCAGDAAPGEISFASLLEPSGASVSSAETAADEPAFIVYTSGTTGKPKGIVHAHRWIVVLGDLNRYRLPPQDDDVV
ncbi:MAG: AMP-binding protein, partial [Candidatus Binatia bacterium]